LTLHTGSTVGKTFIRELTGVPGLGISATGDITTMEGLGLPHWGEFIKGHTLGHTRVLPLDGFEFELLGGVVDDPLTNGFLVSASEVVSVALTGDGTRGAEIVLLEGFISVSNGTVAKGVRHG
jgi:hypothetical protein